MGKTLLYISGWKEHGGAPGIGTICFDEATGSMEFLGKQQDSLSCNCTAIDPKKSILYISLTR